MIHSCELKKKAQAEKEDTILEYYLNISNEQGVE